MQFIVNSSSENILQKEIGGKAYSLYLLQKNIPDLNIPEWFSVKENTHFFIKDSQENFLEFKKQLNKELSKYDESQLWAVRSSASSEDGIKNSFAGQLDTFLYVPKHLVEETILKVWHSIYSEHFLEYAKEKNISVSQSPAVLIQVMINSESAGVGFGINPVTHEKEFIVSSVFGLGNLLVSGQSDADTWIIKDKNIISETLAHKDKKEILDPDNFGTLITFNDNPDSPSLDKNSLLKLEELLSIVNTYYKHPQDIEWALENNKIYLLQSRPVTTSNFEKETLWDNSNIAESYGGVTTPLTFSFAKKAYENVYRELCHILNIPEEKIIKHDDEFQNMLGLIRGRVYYNMNSWYKTLALLPGFSLNKNFMEQMMGVNESISEDLLSEIKSNLEKNKLRDIKNISITSFGMIKSLYSLDKIVANFYVRLDEALEKKYLDSMSLTELISYYNNLELKLLKKWDAPMVNDLFAMIFYGLLRKLSKEWCGDENESVQNTLILTQGNIISAEPAKLMKNMAKKIKSLDLNTIDFSDWKIQVNNSVVKEDIDHYIERFGDRCLDELKLESVTLSDNQELLYQTLYDLHNNAPLMDRDDTSEDNIRSIEMERALVKDLPFFKRKIFSFVIKMARKTVRERENLRFERTRLFGRVRKIFLAIGNKLCEANFIDNSRDIFYLEVSEIQNFIKGTATLTNLKLLIEARKKEFDNFENSAIPSDRFITRGPVYINNLYQGRCKEIILEGNSQKGLGCCPGIVRGKVKIVRNPKNVTVEKGTILVAERTDPGWIMLFSSVSGILVERGSLLSHAAIVSRELNLPAVVSIPGLMNWLKDDDIVEMDGTTGVITKISEAGEVK